VCLKERVSQEKRFISQKTLKHHRINASHFPHCQFSIFTYAEGLHRYFHAKHKHAAPFNPPSKFMTYNYKISIFAKQYFGLCRIKVNRNTALNQNC